MFAVELAARLAAGSVSLLADSLDVLGDAFVYGLSIYAVASGARHKAASAFGLFVFAQVGYKALHPAPPELQLMGGIGVLALAANVACLALFGSIAEMTSTCARSGCARETTSSPMSRVFLPRLRCGEADRLGLT